MKIVPIIFDNEQGRIISYAVIGENNQCVLIDIPAPIGTETWEKEIYNKLQGNSISPSSITLIVITHAHVDHYGSLVKFKEKYGITAPVAIHAHDSNFIELGSSAPIIGYGDGERGEFARYLTTVLPMTGFAKYFPDIVLKNKDKSDFLDFDLSPYGLPEAELIHTPGHTAGSISIIFKEIKTAIIADVCFSEKKTGFDIPLLHYFIQDILLLKKSIIQLLDLGVEIFYGGHGGPWSRKEIQKLLETIE